MAPLNKWHVLLVHSEHPDWTPAQIAQHLDCRSGFVRYHLAREGKQFTRGVRGPDRRERKPYTPRRKATQEQHA